MNARRQNEDDPTGGVDLVVFAAHPDDAELNCGGLLLRARAQGWRTAVVDGTRGELGTLGTTERRAEEAAAAAEVLGLDRRVNLGLPDGRVSDGDAARAEVVRVVRELRPRLVVAPPLDDHHPDHMALGQIVRQSFYLCGVARYPGGEVDAGAWRPHGLLHYVGTLPAAPSLVVDVTSVIEDRRRAVLCYRSQFVREEGTAPVRINADYFLDAIEGRLRYFGSLIGVPFGEAYTSEAPLPVSDPVSLFEKQPWKNA